MVSVKEVVVSGIHIQMVNWEDYQGWEVRASHESENEYAVRGIRLGFVGGHDGPDGEDQFVAYDLAHLEVRRGFTNIKEAVLYLLDHLPVGVPLR